MGGGGIQGEQKRKPSTIFLDEYIQDESNLYADQPIDIVEKHKLKYIQHKLLGFVLCRGPSGTFKTATGILISPNLVLTCAHAIFNQTIHIPFQDIYFYPNQNGTLEDEDYVKVSQSRYPDEYSDKKEGYKRYDYALLRLSHCLNEQQFIDLCCDASGADIDSTIMIYGYPVQKLGFLNGLPKTAGQHGLTKKGYILEVQEEQGFIVHRISTYKGQSGAAVIRQDAEGKLSIIGIHTGNSKHEDYVKKYQDNHPQLNKVNLAKLMTNGMINRLKKFANQMEGNTFGVHTLSNIYQKKLEMKFTMKKEKIKKQIQKKFIQKQKQIIKQFQKTISLKDKEIKQKSKQLSTKNLQLTTLNDQLEKTKNESKILFERQKQENERLKQEAQRLKKQLLEKEQLVSIPPSTFDSGIQGLSVRPFHKKNIQSQIAQTADDYFQEGGTLFRQRKYSDAIRLYKKALEIDPDHINANSNLALAYQHTNNLELAIQCYHKVLLVDPTCEITLNNLGFAQAKNEEWEGAIKCYKKAIEIDPNYSIVYDNLTKIAWDKVSQFVLQETMVFLGGRYPQTTKVTRTLEALRLEYERKIDNS